MTCYKVTVCLFFCRNVIQKTKKLAQFKEENVKVLLMSLGNSAAGTNLIEANYVVLVDPMQGSVEEARAYEMQALGRAHRQGQDQNVHLVRFVVRDSVEEELYTRNKSSGRSKSHPIRFLFWNTNHVPIHNSNHFICSQKQCQPPVTRSLKQSCIQPTRSTPRRQRSFFEQRQ